MKEVKICRIFNHMWSLPSVPAIHSIVTHLLCSFSQYTNVCFHKSAFNIPGWENWKYSAGCACCISKPTFKNINAREIHWRIWPCYSPDIKRLKATNETVSWRISDWNRFVICHVRVTLCLSFKTRTRAKPFI